MTDVVTSIPFRAGHVDLMTPKWFYGDQDGIKQSFERINQEPFSYVETLVLGNEVIAVMGLSMRWSGVAEVIALTSEAVRKAPVSFHKQVLHMLNVCESCLRLHRIQMFVREDYPEGQRWAEALGFKKEALMKQHGADRSDHYLYARCR